MAPTKGKDGFKESLFNMHLRNRHGIFKDYIQKITTFVKELSTKKQTLFGGDEYVIDGNDPICNLMIDYEERIDALKEYEDNESFSVAMTEFQLMYNTYENIMNNHEIFVVLEAFRDERGIDYCHFFTQLSSSVQDVYGNLECFLAVFTKPALSCFYQVIYFINCLKLSTLLTRKKRRRIPVIDFYIIN